MLLPATRDLNSKVLAVQPACFSLGLVYKPHIIRAARSDRETSLAQ